MRHPNVFKKRRKKKANKWSNRQFTFRIYLTDGTVIEDKFPDMSMREVVHYVHENYGAFIMETL